jgi:hypothetical protein
MIRQHGAGPSRPWRAIMLLDGDAIPARMVDGSLQLH